LWLAVGAVVPVSAGEYEVDGEIEQTLFKMDGAVQLVNRSQFTVFVKDWVWLIRTSGFSGSGKTLIARETACANGAEIYEVEGSVDQVNSAGSSRPVRSWNVASIVSNSVPVGTTDDYLVCHLWLMLASGCYFANLATNWLTPVYDLNASVAVHPNLKREAKWDLINGAGSLPRSVVYLEMFGRTNATYLATGVTNTGSVLVPSGFVFEQRVGARFAPGPFGAGESAATYRFRKRAVATVTAVRPACSRSDLLPAAKGLTMVIDRRLTNAVASPKDSLPMYVVRTGAQWAPVEQAKKMYVSRPAAPKRSATVAVVVCGSLLGSSAVLLFFLIKTKGK
jgi:hypothetical protein